MAHHAIASRYGASWRRCASTKPVAYPQLAVTTAHTIATIASLLPYREDSMRLDTILLKVASRCNIDCSYCYVYHQGDTSWERMPKHMSLATVENVRKQLAALYEDQRYPFAVVLHGGGPLLLPRNILEALLQGLADSLPATGKRAIQTNGTLIDADLLDLCLRTKTTISVSLDGPADVNDTFRIAFNGEGTHGRAVAGIDRIRRHPQASEIFTGALCVVDPNSDPRRVYEYF